MDILGKSDPYFILSRMIDGGTWLDMYVALSDLRCYLTREQIQVRSDQKNIGARLGTLRYEFIQVVQR